MAGVALWDQHPIHPQDLQILIYNLQKLRASNETGIIFQSNAGGIALHFDPPLRDPCIRIRRWWGGSPWGWRTWIWTVWRQIQGFRKTFLKQHQIFAQWMNVIICWFLWLCSVDLVMWGSQHVVIAVDMSPDISSMFSAQLLLAAIPLMQADKGGLAYLVHASGLQWGRCIEVQGGIAWIASTHICHRLENQTFHHEHLGAGRGTLGLLMFVDNWFGKF